MAFHLFLGKRGARSGLAFITNRRFLFVGRHRWRRPIVSLPFAEILDVSTEERPLAIERLTIGTGVRNYYFWQSGAERTGLRRLRNALRDRTAGEGSFALPPDLP